LRLPRRSVSESLRPTALEEGRLASPSHARHHGELARSARDAPVARPEFPSRRGERLRQGEAQQIRRDPPFHKGRMSQFLPYQKERFPEGCILVILSVSR